MPRERPHHPSRPWDGVAAFLRSGPTLTPHDLNGDALMSIFARPEKHLLTPERRVLRMREHWASQSWIFAQTLGIEAAAFVLHLMLNPLGPGSWLPQSVVWYGALAGVARFAYHAWHWWDDITMVTDRRVLRVSGLFKEKTDMMPIKKVTDISFGQTFPGRVLGYGWFRIESAGQIQGLEHFPWVSQPDVVEEAVSKLVFGEGSGSESKSLPAPRDGARKKDDGPVDSIDNRWEDSTDD